MVSFRFHLVSLVAVFLALALGIGMGVTVIDKATVDLLQSRLEGVRQDVNQANQRSSQLQIQLDRNGAFADAADRYLINNRLDNIAVTLVRVEGIDTAPLDQLGQSIQDAGGAVRGTITVNDRMALADREDLTDLSKVLETRSEDAAAVRQAFGARVAAALTGTSDAASLKALSDQGFLSWSAGQDGRALSETNFGGSLIVVASGTGAAVDDAAVMLPLVADLAALPNRRVVAVEAGKATSGSTPEVRARFVGPVRSDRAVRDQVSTVDDLEFSSGRVATVLALSQLGSGRTGHYGVASSASSPIPPISS